MPLEVPAEGLLAAGQPATEPLGLHPYGAPVRHPAAPPAEAVTQQLSATLP